MSSPRKDLAWHNHRRAPRGGYNLEDDRRKQCVKAYFDGLAAKDMSRVPWAETATLRTPGNPAGGETRLIQGRRAILDFYNNVLPAIRSVHHSRSYTGDGGWVAGQAEISFANGKTRYALNAFRIEHGEIVEQQNHYDPLSTNG